MANELITALRPDWVGEPYSEPFTGLVANLPAAPNLGVPIRGIRMPHGTTTSIYHVFRYPSNLTLGGGFVFEVVVASPLNANTGDYSATNALFEVKCGRVIPGTHTLDDSVFASGVTAGTFTVTMTAGTPNTVGGFPSNTAAGAISIPGGFTRTVVNMNTPTNSSTMLLKLSRLGTNAGDTNQGDVILLNVFVYNA